jgi:transcriptional regulator with XRE-family HTH domain
MNQNPFEVPDDVNSNMRNIFGNVLREAREASGKTLKQIAAELGKSEEECLEFEKGKRLPLASQLKNLASAYATADGELEGLFQSNHKFGRHKKDDRPILPTYPISSTGHRVNPHHPLDNRKE